MNGRSTDPKNELRRELPVMLMVAVLTVMFAFVVGPFGVLAGAVTAAIWYAFGIPYAVAGGHVTLVALFPDGIDGASLALIETAFVGLLLASLLQTINPRQIAGTALGSALGLASIPWLIRQSQPSWIAAGVFLALFGVAMYGVHRYELVRLGLVPDEPPNDGTSDT